MVPVPSSLPGLGPAGWHHQEATPSGASPATDMRELEPEGRDCTSERHWGGKHCQWSSRVSGPSGLLAPSGPFPGPATCCLSDRCLCLHKAVEGRRVTHGATCISPLTSSWPILLRNNWHLLGVLGPVSVPLGFLLLLTPPLGYPPQVDAQGCRPPPHHLCMPLQGSSYILRYLLLECDSLVSSTTYV